MRQRILFAAVGMILLIGALAAAYLIIGVHHPTGKGSDEPVLFEVTQGEGVSNIKPSEPPSRILVPRDFFRLPASARTGVSG